MLLLAGLYGFQTRRQTLPAPIALPASIFSGPDGQQAALVMGRLDSRVQVVEVMEYQCPACAEAHRRNWPVLRRLVSEGRVAYRAENIPLPAHPNAIPAAVFAACVAETTPERFWEYHHALLERQREWAERYAIDPVLAGLAHQIDADTTVVRSCVSKRGEQIAATLRERYRAFSRAGFSSVPVWSVNGRIVSWEQFESEVLAAERIRTEARR